MTKEIFSKRIIIYDIVGFSVVIIVIWLNELVDMPHLIFGAEATPANIREVTVETLIVIFLGTGVTTITWSLLKRIKYLEGFLPVCSFCNRIRINQTWIPIVDYITDHSAAQFSHGCCPECAEKHYGYILNDRVKMCA